MRRRGNMESQYTRITRMSSQKGPWYQSNSREKQLSSRRKGSIFWTFFRIKQIWSWRTWSFKNRKMSPAANSQLQQTRKELLSSDIHLSGNFLLFIYCMTEILPMLALSGLLIVLDSNRQCCCAQPPPQARPSSSVLWGTATTQTSGCSQRVHQTLQLQILYRDGHFLSFNQVQFWVVVSKCAFFSVY